MIGLTNPLLERVFTSTLKGGPPLLWVDHLLKDGHITKGWIKKGCLKGGYITKGWIDYQRVDEGWFDFQRVVEGWSKGSRRVDTLPQGGLINFRFNSCFKKRFNHLNLIRNLHLF